MEYLFSGAFITLGVMLFEIFYNKRKENPLLYIFIFILSSFTNYLFDNGLNANETKSSMTQEERDVYFMKIHNHYMSAAILSRKAEECLYRYKDKLAENEYHLSNAAITGISIGLLTKKIRSSAFSSAIILLEGLLKDFKRTWDAVNYELHFIAFHLEMAEFYQDLLAAEGGPINK
jgi:hypothetical protein